MAVTVRAATDDDAGAVAALLTQLGYPTSPDDALARRRDVTSAGSEVLVDDDGGRVVGVVSFHVIPLLAEGGGFVRITALAVAEDRRGEGVGRLLVREVERRAREQGATSAEVSSGLKETRIDAHRFYPSLGYRRADQESVVYRRTLVED
ncbi:MAG TPA: GNAT family N-acetyltransferase [Acidimicrobiia bacterium]